jgi:beta-lactamase class A
VKRILCSVILCSLALFISPRIRAQQGSENALLADLNAKLQRDLNAAAAAHDGVMGICVKDLTSGHIFSVNGGAIFPQASSIKIPILIELLRQAQAGKLNLSERVEIHRAGLVGGSGVLQFFSDGGSTLSLHDLAVLMIVLSDNSATNLLINRVGMDSVNSLLDSLGLHQTRLMRKMIDIPAERADRENHSTPREMATLLELLNAGKILDPAHTQTALEILEYPKDSPLRAGIPEDVTVAEKPGSLNGAQCDTGIVFLAGRPYVISVMTTFNPTDGDADITAVSRRVFTYFDRLAHANSFGVRVR